MILDSRINWLSKLGNYMLSDAPQWQEVKQKASIENAWFIPEFVELAATNAARQFLDKENLETWAVGYHVQQENPRPKNVGIVMAGNIPLVGFHDLLAVLVSGNIAIMKPASKDETLIRHLCEVLVEWDPHFSKLIQFRDMLKNCDAYIATGSNNTARYFEYYFGKYPHIIRKNKTSVAILEGLESREELERLSDDVYQFFGLGCRNVTKILVPMNYDFVPLLEAFRKYNWVAEHHKYKNNYDYNLALLILNKKFYMTNGSILLTEGTTAFSPIGQLNYEFYENWESSAQALLQDADLQCLIGRGHIDFGKAQCPSLTDYADNVDTMAFLAGL